MPSSRRSSGGGRTGRLALGFAAWLAATALASRAGSQQLAQGFAVERFYPSAPGGGWFVMDALDIRGGLGGALSVTGGYALKPLVVSDGAKSLAVVSDEAFTDFSVALTYVRWRVYFGLGVPLLIDGQGGIVENRQFIPPSLNLGSNPDSVNDARVGLDARLFGGPTGPFRVGLGTQFFFPSGTQSNYDSDGTVRSMLRALVAGDVGRFGYAGQIGVHVRLLDDAPAPGSAQGSELLFGLAAGPRLALGRSGRTTVVVGPELYGETAFRAPFSSGGTGVEALLSGRLEGTREDGAGFRVRLGTGGGLSPHFGAPEWRIVFGVDLFDVR
jgi:hypothetical protein